MVKYYSEFDDISNNRIRIEIDLEGFSGEPTEILLAYPALNIDYDCDNYFQSLKKSGASINLLVPNVIEDLFSGELLNPKVTIKKNGSLFWFGYISPNIYSQPYKDTLDLLTLECVDTLSNLGNIDFKKTNEISSFLEVITNLLDRVDSGKTINNIYIPTSVKLGNDSDILSNLYIQDRNFLDEVNEPEKGDEVVSSILQYLGFQMMQYKDSYYIIDPTTINTISTYTLYNRTTTNKSTVTLNNQARNVNDIGIGRGEGKVSLGGVFNKVTVIGNNNPLGTILPEFNDESDIVNQNIDKDKYYEETYTYQDESNVLLSGFFKSKSNWIYTQPNISGTVVSEVTQSNRDSITNGVFWQNVDSYKTEDGEPSTLNWKLYLTMVDSPNSFNIPSIQLNTNKTMIIDGGYIIIDMTYKFSTDKRPHAVVKSMYDNYETYGSCSDLKWTNDTEKVGNGGWPDNTMFQAKLTIGDWMYNGEDWELISENQARHQRYMALYYGWGWDMAGTTRYWYRFKNSYDDWEYLTESAWTASTATTKESGECTYANAHYVYRYDSGEEKVYIPDEFYYEFYYGDSFFLVHVNKITENIYDTDYSLTNTVSYKMKIVDSSDGVAIKCRDDVTFYGQLNFTLWACSKLGYNPQPRTDIANTTLRAIHISDLTMKYSKSNSYNSIYSTTTVDPDVKITNIVNSGYCQEMDDVTLKVNTKNEIATSYSYVIGKSGSTYYYIDELNFNGSNSKAENKLVEKLVNYYSTPKYKYSNTLMNNDVAPFSLITESNLNKTMLVTKANYDLTDNRISIECNQL